MTKLTEDMIATFNDAKPMIEAACELSKDMAPMLAKTYKVHFDALVKEGFTPEQAILIASRMIIHAK